MAIKKEDIIEDTKSNVFLSMKPKLDKLMRRKK